MTGRLEASNGAGREKLSLQFVAGYGIGDFAINLGVNLTSIYLLYYFTDVFLIGAAAAGAILMFGRIGMGFIDPFIGMWSDRLETRWGSKRPFLLFGALPLGFCMFALFASPDIPADWRAIYAFVSFTLFFFTMSLINVPYTSLLAVLTTDSRERSLLAGGKVVFAIFGTLIAAGATRPLAGLFESEVIGYRMVGGLYGLFMVAAIVVTFASISEPGKVAAADAIPMKSALKLTKSNRPFLVMSAATFLFQVAMTEMAGMINYFFKYVLLREDLIPIVFTALFIAAAAASPFFVMLSNRTSKKFAYNTGMAILAGALMASYIIGAANIPLVVVFFILAGVGISATFLSPWAMLPDTVEYSQWKTGLRPEGVLFGFFFFSWKLAAAVAGLITGFGLDLIGYIPNTTQTPFTISGLMMLMTLVPAILIIIGMFILSFYPIDERFHKKMLREIRERG